MAKVPTAQEIQEVLPGCYTWQAFCSQAKVDLTSHAILLNGKLYFIDPIRLNSEGLKELEQLDAVPEAILLTNGNHERDAAFYRDRFQIPIYSDPAAAGEFSVVAEPFPSPLDGLEIIPLLGAGLGEIGIYLSSARLLLLGDIIINLSSFEFALLPDKYASDPRQMRKSVALLDELDVNIICFAHGLPITSGASQRLRGLVS